METIRPNDRKFLSANFRRLSGEQCQRIQSAGREVTERTGVRVCEPEAIGLLHKPDASTSEANRGRILSVLGGKALTTVPGRVVVCARHGKRMAPYREISQLLRSGVQLPQHH
jgi:trimethylamine:corrinoid methyltransferase-like protein